MRSAKANDFWKKVYQKQYANYLKTITLSDCMGYSGTILFNNGITAICGLNGVGKSTIISCIKSIIGIEDDSLFTTNKSQGVISAEFVMNRTETAIVNPESAYEKGFNLDMFQYIDSNQAIELLKFWSEQTNITEYLEQFETQQFSEEELEEISWLVGKKYDECISIETDEDCTYKQVFFKVSAYNRHYSSESMGLGEHFLLYMYYLLKKSVSNDAYIIIEEPESYISIMSQQKLMDFIAKMIYERRISVVITTHSPHILKNIHNENILIVYSKCGNMQIITGDKIDSQTHLGVEKQLKPPKIATLFVEDYAARIFLEIMLKEEVPTIIRQVDIVSVGGESHITKRISFDDSQHMDHKFIGIYDGDMRERLDTKDLKWPHLYLPVINCVETEIYEYVSVEANLNKVIEALPINEGIYAVISKHEGEDYHDWFLNICNEINVEYKDFIRAFYSVWKNENSKIIEEFVQSIIGVILGENVLEASRPLAIAPK